MTYRFDDSIRDGVLAHMNGDHGDDNLLIARAFGPSDAVSARMSDLTGDGGVWKAELSDGSTVDVAVAWPGGQITERPRIRAEIVKLYDTACDRLGITPRPHA